MRGPKTGEVYDLRTDGELERDVEPRLVRVIEVLPATGEKMSAAGYEPSVVLVRCSSIPRGVIRDYPIRNFTTERRRQEVR